MRQLLGYNQIMVVVKHLELVEGWNFIIICWLLLDIVFARICCFHWCQHILVVWSGVCRLGRSCDPVLQFVYLISVLQSSIFPLVYSSVIRSCAEFLGDCLGWSCVSSFKMDHDFVICKLSFFMTVVDWLCSWVFRRWQMKIWCGVGADVSDYSNMLVGFY